VLIAFSMIFVIDRHSRLATLLHKLADMLNSDGRTVNITEKPRPLSLASGAISDVELGKVSDVHMPAYALLFTWFHAAASYV